MKDLILNKCPICGEITHLDTILHIKDIPTTQNLVYETIEKAKNCLKGDIQLVYCNNCSFVRNVNFDYNKVDYSENYSYNVFHSKYYIDYVNSQIDCLIKSNYYKNNSLIVEVGCGKGLYLEALSEKLDNCLFYGFDTSYEGELDIVNKNIKYFKLYYPTNNIILKPDIIINRQVIEHIPDPVLFLKSLRSTVDLNSYLFIETPDFSYIVDNKSIFDIYYEHCNYWFPISLTNALELSGYKVEAIISGYKLQTKILGYYGLNLCIIAKAVDTYNTIFSNNLKFDTELNNIFSSSISNYIDAIKKIYNLYKTIAVWGAGPKGITFVNLFDYNNIYISFLIDINPDKQDMYVGKTAHKIISPSKIKSLGIDFIIILNHNYIDEIKKYLYDNNLSYIDIISLKDLY
jgi:hypothetical protein